MWGELHRTRFDSQRCLSPGVPWGGNSQRWLLPWGGEQPALAVPLTLRGLRGAVPLGPLEQPVLAIPSQAVPDAFRGEDLNRLSLKLL